MSCVVLQIRAVHQKLAKGLGSVGHLDAENAFDGQQAGDHVTCRANAAYARGDVGNLGVAAAANHALEQARGFDDVHLNGLNGAVLDHDMNVAVPLDTGKVVDFD